MLKSLSSPADEVLVCRAKVRIFLTVIHTDIVANGIEEIGRMVVRWFLMELEFTSSRYLPSTGDSMHSYHTSNTKQKLTVGSAQ